MAYEERNTWASLIASVLGIAVYAIVIAPQLASTPVAQIDWLAPMLWTIGGAVVGAIVLSILWGIFAGMRDRESVGRSDQRDRDIAHMGARVGQAFLVLAGLGAIALCAVEADWFWIANLLFAGFAVSSIIDGFARVVAYRRGLV
jgi:MFS family permease